MGKDMQVVWRLVKVAGQQSAGYMGWIGDECLCEGVFSLDELFKD